MILILCSISEKLLCRYFEGWTFLQITIVDENAIIEAFAFYLTPEHTEIMNKYENYIIIYCLFSHNYIVISIST